MHENQLQRANELYKLEKYEETIELCNEIVCKSPDSIEAYNRRHYALNRLDRIDEAIDDLNTILELTASSNLGAHFSKAILLIKKADYKNALQDLNILIASEEYYFLESSYFLRCYACIKIGNKEQALEDFKYLPEDSSYPLQVVGNGNFYCKKKDLHEMLSNMID